MIKKLCGFLYLFSYVPFIFGANAAADVKAAVHAHEESSVPSEIDLKDRATDNQVVHPYELVMKILEHYKQKYPHGCPGSIDAEVENEFLKSDNRFVVNLARTILWEERRACAEISAEDYISYYKIKSQRESQFPVEFRIISNIRETPIQLRTFAFKNAVEVFKKSPAMQQAVRQDPTDITQLPLGVSAAQVLEWTGTPRDYAHRWESNTVVTYQLNGCMVTHMGELADLEIDNKISGLLPLVSDCVDIIKSYMPHIRIELNENLMQEIDVGKYSRLEMIDVHNNLLPSIRISGRLPYLRSINLASNFLYELPQNLFLVAPQLREVYCGESHQAAGQGGHHISIAPDHSKFTDNDRRLERVERDNTKAD